MALTDAGLRDLASRLTGVAGVVAVLLGGSRARGTHSPDSDTDLGVYYRPPLDVTALGELARQVAGPAAVVTRPGEWGPWVDGGGWLTIDGAAVDWIYRDVDRVQAAWSAAGQGRYAFHAQTGHPLGVPDFAYPGEVALGVVLAGRWLVNEKGAVAAAAALPGAPPGFRSRAEGLFVGLDAQPAALSAVLDAAADLVLDTADACTLMTRRTGPSPT